MTGERAPVVFDAYGTLFDPAALAEPLERAFPGRGAALAVAWRATQLRHTWLRSLMGAYVDFDTITAQALAQTVREAGLVEPRELTSDLLARYRVLPAYPDVAPGLASLPPEQPLAILTNGRGATVAATVAAAGLSGRIPVVLSVESVRVYKPSPSVYALASDHFGLPPAGIWFVSGNAWDCAGAAASGLRVIRVTRGASNGSEAVGPDPSATIPDLARLASVVLDR
ncbi:MAG: haloacid dehalogenase type II [Chloroflexi bacterium]|nr:haloacid dehalogenase type II [Chloroflexota bacterium]